MGWSGTSSIILRITLSDRTERDALTFYKEDVEDELLEDCATSI